MRAKNALYRSSVVKFIFLVFTVAGIIIGLPFGIEMLSWMIVLAAIIHSLLMLRLVMKVIEANWGAFLKTLIPGLQLMVIIGVKNLLFFILVVSVIYVYLNLS